MFGRKKDRENCGSCDRAIRAGQKVCDCGSATNHMNFDERTRYEVEQWRSYRERTATA